MEAVCNNCSHVTPPKTLQEEGVAINGTSLGPHLTALSEVHQRQNQASIRSIQNTTNTMCPEPVCAATIDNALMALGDRFADYYHSLIENSKKASEIKMDEAPYPIADPALGRKGHMWILIATGGDQEGGDTVGICNEFPHQKGPRGHKAADPHSHNMRRLCGL